MDGWLHSSVTKLMETLSTWPHHHMSADWQQRNRDAEYNVEKKKDHIAKDLLLCWHVESASDKFINKYRQPTNYTMQNKQLQLRQPLNEFRQLADNRLVCPRPLGRYTPTRIIVLTSGTPTCSVFVSV